MSGRHRDGIRQAAGWARALACLLALLGLLMLPAWAAPQAGRLDLSAWEPHSGPVSLDRDWEFYWDRWLMPGESGGQPAYVMASRPWEKHFSSLFPVHGRATYRLRLSLPPSAVNEPLRMRTSSIASRFRCYADGVLMGQNGHALNQEPLADSFFVTFVPFTPKGPSLEILCQVENHALIRSGLSRHLELGLASQVEASERESRIVFSLFEGMFFFFFIYHLILFWQRRQDRAILYFSLICLTTVLYYDSLHVHNLEALIGPIAYEITNRAGGIGCYLFLMQLAAYFHYLLPQDTSARTTRRIVIFSLGASALLALPTNWPPAFGLYYLLWGFIVFVIGYCVLVMLRAWRHQRPGIRTFFFSSLFWMLTCIHDVLQNARVIVSIPYLSILGLVVFCFSQSAFIAGRFNRAFVEAESLSHELQTINLNLEKIVADRTAELAERNQQLQELGQFKFHLTQLLVHDLKNPLSTILGFARSRAISPEQALRRIQDSGLRMLNLLQNLLDIQKLDEARLELLPEPIALQPAAERVLAQMGSLRGEQGPVLRNLLPPGLEVRADAQMLERILSNLLSNALKHTERGEIRIEAEASGGEILISVSDSGVGIAPAHLPHVFTRFRQGGASAGALMPSSGLGLTFCKLAVEAHSGQIGIESRPGQGTRVWFSLPGVAGAVPVNEALPAVLSPASREALLPLLTRLRQHEIYEISDLRLILQELEALPAPEVQAWKQQLEAAIRSFDEAAYQRLLQV